MDDENPMTDASNFHSAPEMGRVGDDEEQKPVEKPEEPSFEETPVESEQPQEEKPEEEAVASTIAVEEISETVTPEPVSEIPEASKNNETETSAPESVAEAVGKELGEAKKVDNPSKILSQDTPYTTIEQSTHNMEQFNAAPKKKANLIATFLIVIITVLVTAVVVFFILKLTQGKKNDNQITESSTAPTVSYTTITCEKEGSVDDRIAVGDATSIEKTIIAAYTDDEMDNIAETTIYTYTDAAAAKTGSAAVKNAYDKKLADIGIENSIKDDPLTTEYALKDATLTETHFAEYEDLTAETAGLIGLTVDKNGEIATDGDSVKKIYKAAGFTCKQKSE